MQECVTTASSTPEILVVESPEFAKVRSMACYIFPCQHEPDKHRQVASAYRRTTQIAISSATPMTDAQTTRSAKMITTAMASATAKIRANAMQTMTRTATVFVRTRMIVH